MSTLAPAITDDQAQAAYSQFVAGVYHPVFFGQLKQAGLAPRTAEEADQALHLGARLYAEYQAEEAAELRKQGSIYSRALAELDGTAAPSPLAGLDRFAKQAAREVLADPGLAAAASVLVDLYEIN